MVAEPTSLPARIAAGATIARRRRPADGGSEIAVPVQHHGGDCSRPSGCVNDALRLPRPLRYTRSRPFLPFGGVGKGRLITYLFGDTDLAARRLGVLAAAFAPSSAEFVARSADRPVELAADLGCGPGHTTHMLADLLDCRRVVGLDSSERFIALAGATAAGRVSFVCHDVTDLPFPIGQSDLLYCRFLLTHLPRPREILARWAEQLRPGGLLLVEEVDSIHTSNAVLAEYVDIVAAILADAGRELYLGPALADAELPLAKRRLSRAVPAVVAANCAATMFSMNMQSWRANRFIQATYSHRQLEQLAGGLRDLSTPGEGGRAVEWQLRQIVYERL